MTQENQWNNSFQGKKKKKTCGEQSQENNPLNQIEIYNQEYQFVVNLT